MIKSDIKTATKLCNQLLNEILERWAQDPQGYNYVIRRIEGYGKEIVLQPTHSDVFYGITDFIEVANACGCNCYIGVQENLDGKMTPTLVIHE